MYTFSFMQTFFRKDCLYLAIAEQSSTGNKIPMRYACSVVVISKRIACLQLSVQSVNFIWLCLTTETKRKPAFIFLFLWTNQFLNFYTWNEKYAYRAFFHLHSPLSIVAGFFHGWIFWLVTWLFTMMTLTTCRQTPYLAKKKSRSLNIPTL